MACDSERILERIPLFAITDFASDSRMSSSLTGLPWFDDIIWINAAHLVRYPTSLKWASLSTKLAHFHII